MTVGARGGGGSGSWASRWPLAGYAGEEGWWLSVAAMGFARNVATADSSSGRYRLEVAWAGSVRKRGDLWWVAAFVPQLLHYCPAFFHVRPQSVRKLILGLFIILYG